MPKKTKVSKGKKEEPSPEESQLESPDLQQLQLENQVLKDLVNLREDSFYRRQNLLFQERQSLALEEIAQVLKFFKELEETEESDEDSDEELEDEEED